MEGMLDRAAGVLMALRRYPVEEAFNELMSAARRHRIPTPGLARALVALAAGSALGDDAAAAARYEWGSLFEQPVGVG